tara:strand:- start:1181 stop:1474 length:294 start_codon:yes stop_codon:yes gene_type:complete
MTYPLNDIQYVAFARKFVKESVDTMSVNELRDYVINALHQDFQEVYDDLGQTGALDDMLSWDEDVFEDVAKDYPIVLEDTEGWTEEDFNDYQKELVQ